ncbi:MAG: toprim domain-containing protein, partial [Oscillospiraceae bacterium]|nr:toprim domain-containing protein [Candidatus Equicaccousia limihippi]
LIARYTDRITLVMDSDVAGRNATDRALKIIEKVGLKAKVVNIPDGKDPDEFVKKNGKDAFLNLISNASENIDYLLSNAAAQFDLTSDSGKIEFLNKAAEIISNQSDVITKDVYTSKLSEKYGIKESVFAQKVAYYSKNRKRQTEKASIKEIITPKYDNNAPNPEKYKHKKAVVCEEIIITVLIKHPDYLKHCEGIEEYFISDINKTVFAKLTEVLRSGGSFDISCFEGVVPNDKMGYIIKLANDDLWTSDISQLFDDSVKTLKQEKEKISLQSNDASDDDWALQMQSILNRKGTKDGEK